MRLLQRWAGGLAALALLASPAAGQEPQAIRAHMAFLASDLMEGREAGTRGYDLAASYVASQLQLLGLQPGGRDGSYLQPVPLLAWRPVGDGELALIGPAGPRPLAPKTEFLIGDTPLAAGLDVEAPLVFVGFGVVAADKGRDDYAGLDLKGKIAVALNGAPKSFQSEERAYHGNSRTKRREAEARGAVGFISVYTPTAERRQAFAEEADEWWSWSMTWRHPDGLPFTAAPKVPYLALVSLEGARALFAGAPHGAEAIMAAAESEAGDPPRFALPLRARVRAAMERRPAESANVVGLIEGSDPALRDEVVVMSAHLDGVGLKEGGEGDRINNGALDNAAGVATLLEAARAFQDSGRRPRRSVMFLFVTAEEKGLIGAEYFARNPTAPRERIVANVNLDMPIITYDFTDVIAFGAERSSLGPMVRRAAGRLGLALSPDPIPEQGIFTRSDHYRFVEQGIPSVFLVTGFAGGGRAAFEDFETHRYHKPGDDLSQAIDYAAGAKFAKLNYELAREIADAPARPRWNEGDFFGARFAKGR